MFIDSQPCFAKLIWQPIAAVNEQEWRIGDSNP
jgi:hypothetical protein